MSGARGPGARLATVGPSLIRAMDADAPIGAISLALGQPGWPMPAAGHDALAALRGEPALPYGPNAGLPAVREALADHTGLPVEQAMVTAGSQAALYALLQAYLPPGGGVLVPDPGFPTYRTHTAAAGGEPVPYLLGPDGALDLGAFAEGLARAEAAGTPAAIALVNHPGNPAGGGTTAQALAEVVTLCARHDVLLISDEVYAELYLADRPVTLADVIDVGTGRLMGDAGVTARCVVVSSVSKGWGAPGLRVGWALGPAELLAPARSVHSAMTTAAAVPSQLAAAALLRASAEVLPAARAGLAERWQLVTTALGDRPMPAGGFYLWWPVERVASSAADQLAWCLALRDRIGVSVVPGLAFGASGGGHVRLSFGGPQDELAEGLRRLVEAGVGGTDDH